MACHCWSYVGECVMDMMYWSNRIWSSVTPGGKEKFISILRVSAEYGVKDEAPVFAGEVIQWLIGNQETFEDKSENYIVRSINNKAKALAKEAPGNVYDPDTDIYAREFVRKNRFDLFDADKFEIGSMFHTMCIDFRVAYNTLSDTERAFLMTTPAGDPEDEVEARKIRARRSDAIKKVTNQMNGYARVTRGPVKVGAHSE
jgi:hypothetical protein